MNKQHKHSNGGRGIEWTDYTWNPIGGCKHGCRWVMPDGTTAICYAEEIANKVARLSYNHGFTHHYWRPDTLNEPLRVKESARIFCDSMSDMFGAWVPSDQIIKALDVMKQASWHTFQSLTKAPGRLLQFNDQFPENLWVGVSAPPSQINGKMLSNNQQARFLHRTLEVLEQIKTPVRWLSIEPLSFDVAPIIEQHPGVIQWVVIGAATNGTKAYQPKAEWVAHLLGVLDSQKVPVFFKGNLTWSPWREHFPAMNDVIYQPKLV